jgi:hypothetical protein
MTDPAILPTIGQVIGAAKDRLIAVRPSAAPHVESGEWSLPITGLRGQFGRAARRLAEEVLASRLGSAAGDALSELAASNYDTPRVDGATFAIGEVTLTRSVVHSGPSGLLSTVGQPDATDQNSFINLAVTIGAALANGVGHTHSIFDATSGLGAHVLVDTSADPTHLYAFIGFDTFVAAANLLKAALNNHFANRRIDTGAALGIHKDVDTVNAVTVADVTTTTPSAIYSAAPAAERARANALLNACKAALNAHVATESRPGVVRAGTLFDLAAVPTASPPVAAAQYRSTRDVYIRAGAQRTDIPLQASRPGAAANLPAWATSAPALAVTARAALFDSGLKPTAIRAAGGGPGQPDPTLVAAAVASWTGSYGPTPSALTAGALRAAGATKVVLREDTATGRTFVHPIDASWAQSARWTASIEQALRGTGQDDEWLGLGCRETIGGIVNQQVRVELVVELRNADYLADTEALTAKIVVLLKAYFDERPDFWSFRLGALRGLVSAADRRRVLACSLAAVRDPAGIPILEPPEPVAGAALTHWWLEQGAVIVDYIAPS